MFKKFEKIKVALGEPYVFNEFITIRNPKIKDVIKFGEHEYLTSVKLWDAKPSEFMVELEDQGIDYFKIDNYELFLTFFQDETLSKYMYWWFEDEELNFKLCQNNQNNLYVLYDSEKDIIIDKHVYLEISDYIRFINLVDKKPKYNPTNDLTRQYLTRMMREDREYELKKMRNESNDDIGGLLKYINAIAWNENSPININQVWDLTIYQLYCAIKQITNIYQFNQFIAICSSGNFDTKKMNKDVNWY